MSNSNSASNFSSANNGSTMSDQARQTVQRVASGAVEIGQDAADYYVKEPAKDLFSLAKDYAKEHPDVAACWAFGLGVFVGWKLKP